MKYRSDVILSRSPKRYSRKDAILLIFNRTHNLCYLLIKNKIITLLFTLGAPKVNQRAYYIKENDNRHRQKLHRNQKYQTYNQKYIT